MKAHKTQETRVCLRIGLTLGLIAWLGFAGFAQAGAQAPFTWNASTKIVVDDNLQYTASDIRNGGWTNYVTNIVWSAGFTDTTAVGWYNVIWPGARPSHNGMLPAWSAVRYLSDAITRMTGARPVSIGDHSYPADNAIVLTTVSTLQMATNVPADLLTHAAQALAVGNGAPLFSAKEAYYIHTENNAIYIVANEMQGLSHGVVELLLGDHALAPRYQIGYETLGMGPNWTYVPDFTSKPLVFNMEFAGRPGLYQRSEGATRGGRVGATGATISYAWLRKAFPNGLPAPDEPVEISDRDLMVGWRLDGQSAPGGPSQALEVHAYTIATNMIATGSSNGFLCVTKLGLDADRPPASKKTLDWLWLDTDPSGTNKGNIWFCTCERENPNTPKWLNRTKVMQSCVPPHIDLSVPAVQQLLLKDMIKQAESLWSTTPGQPYYYPHAEPSDGGLADPDFIKITAYPNWYSDYRKAEKQPWGRYVLGGFYHGLPVQPTENWWNTMSPVDTNNAQADTVYALNNWLLREFDKYVASLPAANRLSGGISKTNLIHTMCFSYGTHDVPPNFNLDHRVRMQISGMCGHRGHGKWIFCQTFKDVMRGIHVMLPECDLSEYWCYIVSFPNSDWGLTTMSQTGFCTPSDVHGWIYDNFYAVGGREFTVEADYDYGKNGLTYYMFAKMFWEPTMSLAQLTALRDRWLVRSYGALAADTMRQYYNWMNPERFVCSTNFYAQAIHYIQQADALIPPGTQQKRRLDDLKQFWYFYYLQYQVTDPKNNNWQNNILPNISADVKNEIREFLWKGQMSYMTPLYCITWSMLFPPRLQGIGELCKPEYFNPKENYIAPAHYTAAETAKWWDKVVKYWSYTPVNSWDHAVLANGEAATEVDLHNLISVKEMKSATSSKSWLIYWAVSPSSSLFFAGKAGTRIGMHILADAPEPFAMSYSVHQWNPASKQWNNVHQAAMTSAVGSNGNSSPQVLTIQYDTAVGGVYRIDTSGSAGHYALKILPLDYTIANDTYSGAATPQGLTFDRDLKPPHPYASYPPGYVYIPKGTKSLDLEPGGNGNAVQLYTGMPSTGLKPNRLIRLSNTTTRIALNPGEAGSIAKFSSVAPPYLYSIPNLWSIAPELLLVPRDIAVADGLTPYQPLPGTDRR